MARGGQGSSVSISRDDSGSGSSTSASRGGGFFGGYTSFGDMFDGGGPGRSGDTFGGALGGVSNALGLSPMGGGGGGGGGDGGGGGFTFSRGLDVTPLGLDFGAGARGFWGGTMGGAPVAPAAPFGGFAERGLGGEAPMVPAQAALAAAPAIVAAPEAVLTPEEISRRNAERSKVPTFEAGGMVGPAGMPIRPSTVSLDLPPALARLVAMPVQSYAEGGLVGPGGIPQRPMTSPMAMQLGQQGGAPIVGVSPPGGGQGRPMNFAAIDQQAQQFVQQNPQQVQQIRAQVEQAMAAGEVDAQSLNMFVQIATTALQNPEMWPQLRQVLIRQGMLDADEVSEEFDQGFLIVLYIIGKSMGGVGMQTTPAAPQGQMPAAPQGQMPMSAGQAPEMSMAKGGALPAKSKNPDGSIPINAHEGEYVIPADVTRRLGTDHFDKLIAKARGVDGKGEQ
jgi:hypothetical protein